MKIDVLKEVIDLSETLNFTKTAANRYITQPALSRHIAAFEKEIGITVFAREQHNVRLTEQGIPIVSQARKVIAAYDSFMGVVDIVKEGYSERLRVGYLVAASRPFISHASALFEKRFKNVLVEYEPMSPKEIREAFIKGTIDLGFTASTFADIRDPWASEDIYEDEYCIAVGREHPLAGRESVRLEELEGMEVSFPGADFAPVEGRLYHDVFGHIDYTPSRRKHRGIQDVSVILANGRTVAPMLAHGRHYGERSIELIPFEDSPFEMAHVIAVFNGEEKPAHVDDFIACAHEGYALSREMGF